jgi:hypothetical protein
MIQFDNNGNFTNVSHIASYGYNISMGNGKSEEF